MNHGFSAKIIADSLSESNGHRLTTLEITYPRIILAEINTHRKCSRSTASSRAIPIEKMISAVKEHPFVPEEWPANGKGMWSSKLIGVPEYATQTWLEARDKAVEMALKMNTLGVHKQYVNRLLEPFMWTTTIISSTEWQNMFDQRISEFAQPEFCKIAIMMRDAIDTSVPNVVSNDCPPDNRWHLPYITDEDRKQYTRPDLCQISAARCARVSYVQHDTGKMDAKKDIKMCQEKLLTGKHMSPFEHVAYVSHLFLKGSGNFDGWVQYRHVLETWLNFSDLLEKEGS